MSEDEQHMGPDDEQDPSPEERAPVLDEERDAGPKDEGREDDGTNLTRLEGLPTDRADLTTEKVTLEWTVTAGRFNNQLTLEASTPTQGMVSPAMAIAVVTVFVGATAAVLIAVGAPVWLALSWSLLPGVALGIVFCTVAVRTRADRAVDARQILGWRLGKGRRADGEPGADNEDSGDAGDQGDGNAMR
jgi:hypothetical protein